MLRNLLLKLVLATIAWPVWGTEPSRIQAELPIYDLRQMVTRYSVGAAARATIGQIRNEQYFPVDTFSLGALGTTDCSALLDRAQAFPLEGMLKAKYIDQETFDALTQSARYLHADQVTFYSVLSYLSKEEFANHRSMISDAQLGNAPPRSKQDPTSVAVTVGSAFLVAGYRHTGSGLEKAPLPWAKDPTFAEMANKVLAESDGLNFEMGRAMQVTAGTLDYNINAVLMTVAHEMAIHRADFSKARIFVHSYKRANTVLYRRKFPSLQVIATDPKNPENVVLATPLDKLFSKDKPWNYSGPIQSLVSVNPQVLTVSKVWEFLTALRSSGAVNFDYIDSLGKRGPFPIVLRLPSDIFSSLVSAYTSKMGITTQQEADRIVGALQSSALLTNDSDMANFADPASVSVATKFEFSKNTIALSGLDPKESKVDSDYELRVLISGVMQYGEILRWAGLAGIKNARYALITTDSEVAEKIARLGPSEKRSDPVQMDWSLQNDPKGATFNFVQATAKSFIFSFADIERLAKAKPDLFKSLQENPAIRFGDFHRRSLLSRPTGL